MDSEREFRQLAVEYGHGRAEWRDVTVEYSDPRLFQRYVIGRTDRRGEVVFGVERPSGRVVVTRARDYGPGIFRLPSGGIEPDETALAALMREVREELGLTVAIAAFFGVVQLRFRCGNDERLFPAYVFHVRETGGRLLTDATDQEIVGYAEVDWAGLNALVARLGSLAGDIGPWGRNRAATTGFFAEHWLGA
ncbi:MAG: NUDIX hydrolase [Chloroflexota bacterium]